MKLFSEFGTIHMNGLIHRNELPRKYAPGCFQDTGGINSVDRKCVVLRHCKERSNTPYLLKILNPRG